VDRKNRTINLSVKAKDQDDESAAMEEYAATDDTGTTSLGDLLKEQMSEK